MAWYNVGTVTVTTGSTLVTGAGTDFVNNVSARDAFTLIGGNPNEIASVQSATQMTLARPWLGATAGGQAYAVIPTVGIYVDLALRALNMLTPFQAVLDGIGQGLVAAGTPTVPGIRFSTDQDTGIRYAGANTIALVTGGVDAVVFAPSGTTFTYPFKRNITIEGTGAGVTDVQVALKTPERQFNVGVNIGGSGVGLFGIYDATAGGLRFAIDGGGIVRPGLDNAQPLGAASFRWSVIYAGTGSINTSDARTKEQIGSIPDDWLDAWGDVVWSRFRFCDAVERKGGNARWHLGLIAQDVRDAFAARGLDASEIGLLCFDSWDAVPASPPVAEEIGADRQVLVPASPGNPGREAGDRWGLRYDECQAMEAAWQRRRIAQLEARLDTLAVAA